ncbi:winged helix-turn-helix domain-containing protein (plasmid) [Ensifer adhaerens]|uniref:winged helix-turn-helix domain-containing protein n=1 Tax=Ensifer adhaerens TaxID=106592 RepID=UPI001CBE45D9|nr:winged helix-turn-helix domain-containing protein [Ensifer adhaerens]MBZ7927264.1 winged helix-turn-helix domain-containing protein [Ensifer adhaerens]UAX98405.1 winged helix-turn-helix domain-containing protein [Ensifer adhaerens]UAY05787.1 winged helix-turn-helix domain-containing protein [Ensifer adhaerens]UAY13165.1 winged helix-turn-helix domain-containing protein [Ensifer adhaerens]
MRVLVIEDDAETASYINNGLTEDGHLVDVAADGRDGLLQATTDDYDVLIVDRMLPVLDGLSLVKALRSVGKATPVLYLTSLGGVDDRVKGFEAGGDDYVLKPFYFSELLARVNALGRRPPLKDEETTLRFRDLEMNLSRRVVQRAGVTIDLQPREFRLLEVLLRNRGKVVTRTMLLERVWDFHFEPKTSVVETHISRLRTKIDKPFDTELIHTVRGAGYIIDDHV